MPLIERDSQMPVATEPLTRERLVSLDLLRGLAVIGMIMVNEMAGMAPARLPAPASFALGRADDRRRRLSRVPVHGRRLDPALASGGKSGSDYSRILWRAFRLILLGFILSNIFWFSQFSSGSWRLFGVLQRIGLVYGVCAIMFLKVAPRTRLIVAAAILLLYWPLTLHSDAGRGPDRLCGSGA